MAYIGYLLFRVLVFLFWITPFPILYLLSDCLSLILQYIVRYRRDVVSNNLRHSFPQLSKDKLNVIERESYRNLSDILLEGIKGLSMSKASLRKRYNWKNPELTDKFASDNRHVVGMSAHCANWEWGGLCIGYYHKHRAVVFVKPIANEHINKFIQKERMSDDVLAVSIYETRKRMATLLDKPTLFMYVTDQTPSNLEKAYWTGFLGQDTPCLHGADNIAREKDWPVVMYLSRRIKRGYYEVTPEVLFQYTADLAPGDIIKTYMVELEKHISKYPSEWLWSHKRWKWSHKAPTNIG